ncbi:DsbE family thiol:disulfide interchange protein [Bisgaard Taxon 10/6]|uniref:DsbE family thiol:disulfide interchange protein n=1 Tax=Exercitatus varius TaxID=67857 RepID=UPI00294B5039|nr:DsbE family thiol:disulfide interchange protein [Exercitatus varius]MDG2947433.1 DsbE family thiol:disulfide interchange protein [Exercitatus varius]MDG2956363.1 DsbE family thiol:disulfide interchange protein [Exercitatus varius]MDG2961908.1 DsbE family thiol:disulfide interchange protein [Exercitatus varius]MDG2964256.1 DsbE family thiol:disulfide interchange protein [Exercitatus varius]
MKKKIILFLPLVLILTVCALLFVGLQQDPKKIASALIDKPVPEFFQADLQNPDQIVSNKNLPKTAHLINIWGSWCYYCKQEHGLLLELAKQGVQIVGLNYRDKRQNALEYLQHWGNPFLFNIDDSRGKLAMQLGVDGAPETYVVDKYGVIRYRQSGALDRKIIENVLLPELEKLK